MFEEDLLAVNRAGLTDQQAGRDNTSARPVFSDPEIKSCEEASPGQKQDCLGWRRRLLIFEQRKNFAARQKSNSSFNNLNVCLGLLGLLNDYEIDWIFELIHEGFDVLVLTKTWHSSHDEFFVKMAVFDFIDFLKPHDPHYGGIIVYFRNTILRKRIELPTTFTLEALAKKFKINGIDVILLAIYRQ
ncbi:hypothetical protein HELRODRAFT_162999 [Helobdella robusta]|uniref:Uncharacterized protein n=1 Tax=Helobdella robusta TaxID=6412 RepID=T1ETJ1_HELRO|nr:hypothetical protein HELRODRAFT_162999 [Helobdella robusta]ESN99450.1 hypothetical protein HELRODRAFT_162999 [Helobdella robusta]